MKHEKAQLSKMEEERLSVVFGDQASWPRSEGNKGYSSLLFLLHREHPGHRDVSYLCLCPQSLAQRRCSVSVW